MVNGMVTKNEQTAFYVCSKVKYLAQTTVVELTKACFEFVMMVKSNSSMHDMSLDTTTILLKRILSCCDFIYADGGTRL